MTNSRLTPVAAIIAALMGLLILDDLIAAAIGQWHLSAGQIAWRLGPLVAGAIALTIIATRTGSPK